MQLPSGTQITATAFLFDMDGTLVDSTVVIERVWRRWAEKHHFDDNRFQQLMAASHGCRTIDTVRQFAPAHYNIDEEVARLTMEEENDIEGIIAIKGSVAFINMIPPHCWAVVTSASELLAKRRLLAAGLPIPSVLISSESVKKGKPAPDCFQLGAKMLDISPTKVLAFEDSEAGLQAATASGAKTIAITETLDATKPMRYDSVKNYTVFLAVP